VAKAAEDEAEEAEEDESAEVTEEVAEAAEEEAEAASPTPSQLHRHQAVSSPWHSPAGCRA
jgi:hypothetical protein